MDISVIIPTHNNASSIKETILSVVNQDFKGEYEIIVLNDSSTDGSDVIIKELAKEYKIIKYHEVNNRSLPRNRIEGVKLAKGKYIMFLDGDDKYAPNMLSRMYEEITSNDYDLVNCGFYYLRKNNRIEKAIDSTDKELDKYQAIKALFKDTFYRGYMHTKIFKKDIFSKIDFPNIGNIMYEDTLFNFYYLINCNKIKCIKDRLHYYNKTNEGAMTRTGYNRCHDNMAVRNSIRNKIEELNDDKLRKIFLKSRFRIWLLLFSDFLLSKFPDYKTKVEIRKLVYSDFHNVYSKRFDKVKANFKYLMY